MVSRIKYKGGIGEITAELEINIEGNPIVDVVEDIMNKVNIKVMELRTFNYQFELNNPVNIENDGEVEETSNIRPNLSIEQVTSTELEKKSEQKIDNDVMVA